MKHITSIFTSTFFCMLVTCIGCNTYKPNVTFTEAVEQGDAKAVSFYIKKGEMINQKDSDGNPLIILASEQKNPEILKNLIKAGADVNATGKNGDTALITAIRNRNVENVKYLIQTKADVNQKNRDGMTPLMVATSEGPKLLFIALSEVKRDIGNDEAKNKRALEAVGEQMDIFREITSILHKAGALIEAKNNDGQTALILASQNPYSSSLVSELLNFQPDVNAQDNKGMTALMMTGLFGNDSTAKLLVMHGLQQELRGKTGLNINATDKTGATALMMASARGSTEVVKVLLQNGTNVNIKMYPNITALYFAKKTNHQNIVNLLKQAGAKE